MLNHSWRKASNYKSNPTALDLAVQSNTPDLGKIEELIKRSIGKNATSAFLIAVKQGKKEVIKLFFKYPDKIDFSVTDGFYGLLHLAIQKDVNAFPIKELFEDHSQLITSGKIDINAKDYRDQTPLHIGVLESKIEWIQHLLKVGANLHAKDKDGNTPLSLAMKPLDFDDGVQYDQEFRQAEVIKAFLESGKININDPVDYMGNTLLHLAMVNDNHLMLSEILKHNPNFNALNKDGSSPLDMAVEYQKDEALQLTLEYAYKHNVQIKCGSATDINERDALKVAIENNYSIESIKKLLESGADPNKKDNSGYTALHCAADYNDDPKVLELLIQYKADPKIKNNEGHTPLDIANQYDNQEIIKVLEKASKDGEKKASKKTIKASNQQDKNLTKENTSKKISKRSIGAQVGTYFKESVVKPIIEVLRKI